MIPVYAFALTLLEAILLQHRRSSWIPLALEPPGRLRTFLKAPSIPENATLPPDDLILRGRRTKPATKN